MNWHDIAELVNRADARAWFVCVAVALTVFVGSVLLLRNWRNKPSRVEFTPESAAAFFESETGWHLMADSESDERSETPDRRRTLRRPGNFVPVHLSDAQVRARPKRAWVLDRSTGGLRIAVDKELPAGVILSVRAENAPESTPWVQVQVRSCRRMDNFYELGCQFLETPPWAVLLLFG